ncbi:MAG: hypothetical protein HYS74_00260 [Parcubacteria group bacterium]|nr:hypothetical protein [Parcubacteria group bacterium]
MFKAIVIFIVSFIIAVLFAAFAFPANAAESVCDSPEWWEKYEGTEWEGAWSTVGGAGKISVSLSCLYTPQQARYEVVDGPKTYRWTSRVRFKDPSTLVFTNPPGFPRRVDTYALGSDGKTLRGDYTFEGKDWGKVSLSRKKEVTAYVYLKSASALEGLTFEGEWRSGGLGGKQVIKFIDGRRAEITIYENGVMLKPWIAEVYQALGILRLVANTRVEIVRLRMEEKRGTIVLDGISYRNRTADYPWSFTLRTQATPEQISKLR